MAAAGRPPRGARRAGNIRRVERASRRTTEAAAETGLETARAAVDAPPPGPARGAGSTDPLIGDLRRAGLLPLLVLHFASQEPAYGNQLIERIAALTSGALAVNPNTMYPLLRSLESQGLVAGEWEHPERRSRRFYRVTPEGEAERQRLASELGPRLDRIARSIRAIRAELL
jgi:PadR family transcriptional regulator PadR